MSRLWWCVAQSIIFPTGTELTVLKQLCHSHGVSPQSQTCVTLQFTGLTPVFPSTLKTLGDTPHQDCRSSQAGGPWADNAAAGMWDLLAVSKCVDSLMFKVPVPLVMASKYFTSINSRNPHENPRDCGIKSTQWPRLTILTHLSDRPGCETQISDSQGCAFNHNSRVSEWE